MLDVLSRHTDVVGDLVNLVALLSAGEDASLAQPVNCWMVGVVGINVPIVFLDLGTNPFLPAATGDTAFWGVSESASPPRAKAVGSVLHSPGRIEVQILTETLDRFQPAGIREGHRRLGPSVDLDRICRGKRDVEGAPALAGFFCRHGAKNLAGGRNVGLF